MLKLLVDLTREPLGDTVIFSVLQVFQWVTFRAIAALILAFFVVVLLGPRVIRFLLKQKIGDAPEFDHADLNRLTRQKANTPTMGGVLISAAIFLSVLMLADIGNFYVQMGLLCLVWLSVLGGADDWLKLTARRRNPGARQGLYSWEKILFQIGLALLLGLFIHFHGANNPQTHMLALPFQRTYPPGQAPQLAEGLIFLTPFWFTLLTIFILVGFSNAANLTDGMDGLASGVMSIVAFAFMILCFIIGSDAWAPQLLMPFIPGSEELAVLAGAMVGGCLGFLWYNCHPAQVFMGDTGSLPLGGLIGYIAVVIRQEFLLLIIGGILVAEAGSVLLQVAYFKATGGSRLFKCTPIHHHFHLGGWSEQQVVVRFWLLTALFAAVALATLRLR